MTIMFFDQNIAYDENKTGLYVKIYQIFSVNNMINAHF